MTSPEEASRSSPCSPAVPVDAGGAAPERHTASPAATEALGRAMGAACRGGEVFLLDGDLGAGKTCWTRGLARGLGVPAEEPVTSPTFVLHVRYHGRLVLDHVDAYRLGDTADAHELGILEFLGHPEHVTVIEWPAFFGPLPGPAYRIEIETTGPEARCFRLVTMGEDVADGCAPLSESVGAAFAAWRGEEGARDRAKSRPEASP